MPQYQQIEYRIGKDGQVTETVINASGPTCVSSTTKLEAELGQVTHQEFRPEYYSEAPTDLEELVIQHNQYV